MAYNKYYVYKEAVSYDSGTTWIYTGNEAPSGNPIATYDTLAECEGTTQYRTLTTATTCVGYDKYTLAEYQVSYDSGVTWTTTGTSATTLIEANSEDCGYYPPIYRWVDSGTTCIDHDKYNKQIKQVSNDNGETWENVVPLEESVTTLAEHCSADCGASTTPSSSGDYFTVHALEDGFYYFGFDSSSSSHEYYYWSTDNGETWTRTLMNLPNVPEIKACERIMFKASWINSGWTYDGYSLFATAQCELEGNVMSLMYSDAFKDLPNYGLNASIANELLTYHFISSGSRNNIYSAENLIIPSVSNLLSGLEQVWHGCAGMFENCENLVKAPSVLPATTLLSGCYSYMFEGCTSLTTAPELPATTLAERCYRQMFYGCTSLTTAPDLPATTLAVSCYLSMFKYCRNLNSVTCLATDISARDTTYGNLCTQGWLSEVSASGTFTKASSMNDWTRDANGIPSGWTVLNA